jgi:DNA replication protein DnaC
MSLEHERLLQMLGRLQLRTMRERIDSLLEEAARKELGYRDFLLGLCELETLSRDERRIEMGIKIAKFPFVRTLESFDFAAQPSLDRARIVELGHCRWVANGENLLLLGPPGVGKTHLCVGLGREAVKHGYSVLFVQAAQMLASLVKAHQDGKLEERLAFFAKPKLLLVDELGYLPFERSAAHLFFQLVARRYERGSLLLTSNRSVGEWGEVFSDPVLATAILDRLLHHSHVLTIRGESYRLREKRRSGLLKSSPGAALSGSDT